MSAHIHLSLTPAGEPVVIASSKKDASRALVLYFKEGPEFKQYEIDMKGMAERFGLGRIDASSTKQILFDDEGVAHIAFCSNADITSEIVYLALDQHWHVVDQRAFAGRALFGMGIDSSRAIHVAFL